MSIKKCQEWLDKLKLDDIPKHKERKKTIMDIAGIEHLETKWSLIYAYFFNPKESHGLGTLFYDSLSEILLHKNPNKKIQMNDFYVKTEVPAREKDGSTKFIDILLGDGEYAIIIENKVNASLDNPLQTYWNSIKIDDSKKCGIVLSLYDLNASKYNSNYINITHEELIKQVENNLYKHYLSADSKALIFLQDFIQNIYNQKNTMDKDLLEFYYKGTNHIKAYKLTQATDYLINSLSERIENDDINNLVKNILNLNISKKKNKRYTYYCYVKCKQAMITLVYNTLWNYSEICRIQAKLEFQGDIKRWIEDEISKRNQFLMAEMPNPDSKHESNYWHFASEDLIFENPTDELGDVFQNIICEKIKNSKVYELGCKIVDLYIGQK